MTMRGLLVAGGGGGALPLPTKQELCDQVQAELRAAMPRSLYRTPPARPAPLAPTNDPMMLRLAGEVAYMQRIIDAAGDVLAGDAVITSRHPQTLQQFDIVSQVLGHVATVLGAEDRKEAVARVGMTDLRARLSPRSL